MAGLSVQSVAPRGIAVPEPGAPRIPSPPFLPAIATDPDAERRVRTELRRQIGVLEVRLGEAFATAFPRLEIDWSVGALGGPRILGVAELERVRDALVFRLSEARSALAGRAEIEEQNRALVERMIIDPQDYRWVQVSNADIGQPGCKHWHVQPRWGIVGVFLNWWRVKLSSGCPLAAFSAR